MSVELFPRWWRRILAWFANRQLRRARVPFHCPSCGAASPSRVHADLLWEEVMPCPECGGRAPIVSYLELKMSPDTEEVSFAETLNPVNRPADTRIVAERTGSGHRWEIPAKGGWNVWLVFAIVWLVFTTVVFGGTFLKAENWMQVLAPLMFPIIGLGILYAGLRMSFARHTLEVDPVELVYTRHFLGGSKRRAVKRESIESVQLACIYVEDGRPVYGLEVKSPSGRIRFGSALAPQEKAWLCQQVREALGMALQPEELSSASAVSQWRGGRLEMERDSHHALVRVQSRAVGTVALVMGAFFAGMGLFMLQGGSQMWMPWEEDTGFFFFLFNGFTLIWTFGVVMAVLASTWILAFGWISRRTTKTLQADSRSLSITATSGRRVIQHTWKAEDVGRMSVVSGMHMNGTPLYHAVVTLPDRVVTFGFGAPRADLHRAVALLGEVLGRKTPDRT